MFRLVASRTPPAKIAAPWWLFQSGQTASCVGYCMKPPFVFCFRAERTAHGGHQPDLRRLSYKIQHTAAPSIWTLLRKLSTPIVCSPRSRRFSLTNLLPRISKGLDCSLIGLKHPVLTNPLTTGGVARQRSRLSIPSTNSSHISTLCNWSQIEFIVARYVLNTTFSSPLGLLRLSPPFHWYFSSTLSSDRPPLSVQITRHRNTALYTLSHSLLSSRDRCSDLSHSDRSACSPQRLAIDRLHFF